ncbi:MULTISPECIES: HD domain-containing protein [Flavobacterium]|uniref:HD domain-containing protein n=1 Tax=Flavobacterium jumunjinense TaxID=998845 RepID=A0ABV5GSV6_9FLAO|nr:MULTISPECIES: HD domain-containing protein [Flavobacterium]
MQTLYQKALLFAAEKHTEAKQLLTGSQLPYVVHLSNVAMEVLVASQHSENLDINFAIQIALLHDTIEDTATTFNDIEAHFNKEIAEAVLALTKNENLEKNIRMTDSLTRIKKLKKEVAAVKLADRITNLQTPPKQWDNEKIKNYHKEALQILETLSGTNEYLENRLQAKIEEYKHFF